MKNRTLISKLKQYNLDADVTLTTSEDIFISYINQDSKGNELTKKTTMQLFIEDVDSYIECVHEYINEDYDEKWCSHYDAPCYNPKDCYEYEEFYG